MRVNGRGGLVEAVFEFNQVNQLYFEQQVKALGLTMYQARILNYVAAHPGTIQRPLTTVLGKPAATVTNILKVMVRNHLLERRVPQDNGRQKQLFLTAQGRSQFSAVENIFADRDQQVTQLVDPQLLDSLLSTVRRVTEQILANQ